MDATPPEVADRLPTLPKPRKPGTLTRKEAAALEARRAAGNVKPRDDRRAPAQRRAGTPSRKQAAAPARAPADAVAAPGVSDGAVEPPPRARTRTEAAALAVAALAAESVPAR